MGAAEKLRILLQYAMAVAAEEDDFVDQSLTKTVLMKYAYVGELAYAERHGKTFSNSTWTFFHFGPFSNLAGDEMESAVEGVGGEMKTGDGWTAFRAPRGKADEVVRMLPPFVATAIRQAVQKHGSQSESLLAEVYRSKPMRYCRPGSELDFRRCLNRGSNVEAKPELTKRQQKKQSARRIEARERFREKLQMRAQRFVEVRPELDSEVLQALKLIKEEDGRESDIPADCSGSLHIADDVWDHPSRTEDELP